MTVQFLLQRHDRQNYVQQNLLDVIGSINDPVIQEAFLDDRARIQVHGPVHRTQLTSDNPEYYFWIRLSVQDGEGNIIPGYGGVHIFLCFQLFQWTGTGYRLGQCITPEPYSDHVDIANVENMFGYWRTVRFTLGVQNAFQQIKVETPRVPRKRTPLVIMDPKTGHKIE